MQRALALNESSTRNYLFTGEARMVQVTHLNMGYCGRYRSSSRLPLLYQVTTPPISSIVRSRFRAANFRFGSISGGSFASAGDQFLRLVGVG
jgi:hypothetical protein